MGKFHQTENFLPAPTPWWKQRLFCILLKPSRSLEGQIHWSSAPGGQEYHVPFGPKCSWPQLKEQSQHIPRSLLAAENAPGRGNGLPCTSRPSLEITHPSIIPSQARPYKVGKVARAIWKGAEQKWPCMGNGTWQGQLLARTGAVIHQAPHSRSIPARAAANPLHGFF